jgi:spermidine synthase
MVILPEDVLFFMASPGALTHDPQVLIHRLEERGIHSYFIIPQAIRYRYTTDRVALTEAVFKANTTVSINTDLHPQGYLYNLIYWLSVFHQDLSALLSTMVRTNYIFVLLLAIGLITLLFLVKRKVFLAAMAMGGFSLMAAEVIVIYEFQVFYGHLYYTIAWIIAAFMATTALGAFWGNNTSSFKLVKLHLGLGGCFLFWLFLPGFWIIWGLGTGLFVGLEFSYISRFRRESIYAADLLGSCGGALGVSVFMIPAYGVYLTLLFLMIINTTLALVIQKKGTL